MAKKKSKKVDVKAKLNYKKPLKSCVPALDDFTRIRKNEQNKLYRMRKKFEAIPTKGKKAKAKGVKKQSDELRKQIKAQERNISSLGKSRASIKNSCEIIDGNKAKIKSLKLKKSAKERALKKFPKKAGVTESPEYKKLRNEILKLQNEYKELEFKNTVIMYGVNKYLGFSPEVIAGQLNIPKKELEKNFKDDFEEEYFEEAEEFELPTEGAGGGLPTVEEILGEDEEEEEEIEEEVGGFIQEMDDMFWQVDRDFKGNERGRLASYDQIIIQFNGRTYKYAGSNLVMIEMKFDDMVRWLNENQRKDQYGMIEKLVNSEANSLKYIGYFV